jgi:D-alanyl-D-alanine carboxypeptidase
VPGLKSFYPIPILKEGHSPFPIISAQSALAIDLNSREILYEKNSDLRLLPASTTKIITALVALESYGLDDVLEVKINTIDGQKMGLKKGEKITAGSLIKGLLIYSANDAAETLAENFPGGKDAFIKRMNQKAEELNLNNSHFENPVGFDGNGQYTTAGDLILSAEAVMKTPLLSGVVGENEDIVTSYDGKIVHHLKTTNELLGQDGVVGVKTGWTQNARENFVAYSRKDGRHIMVAVLGSQDRFGETKELIDWIFGNYQWQEVKVPQE